VRTPHNKKDADMEIKRSASQPSGIRTALQKQLDGKVVEWMEQVSDEQYQGA
jgi:hypothetical protein